MKRSRTQVRSDQSNIAWLVSLGSFQAQQAAGAPPAQGDEHAAAEVDGRPSAVEAGDVRAWASQGRAPAPAEALR